MRHEQLSTKAAEAREVPVAAVWPHIFEATVAAAPPAPSGAPTLPTPAVPDVPRSVWKLLVGSYVALVAVLFAFMARSPLSLFSITIAAGFVAVYFAVPRLFLEIEADATRRPSFDRLMDRGIDTLTGRTAGKDALLQMLIVPLFLTLGLGAMGVIGFIYI